MFPQKFPQGNLWGNILPDFALIPPFSLLCDFRETLCLSAFSGFPPLNLVVPLGLWVDLGKGVKVRELGMFYDCF